jgi:hypothetical protein
MYVGAVVELAAAITILATIGDVRSNVVQRNPDLTGGEWHAIVAGQLVPTAVAAGIAVGFWLWMAWAIGRGHRWAPMVLMRPRVPRSNRSVCAAVKLMYVGRTCGRRRQLPREARRMTAS